MEGWQTDDDRAEFTTRFLDSTGNELGRATITGPDADGRSEQTGLFHLSLNGALPADVHFLEFLLSAEGNDAYADNLTFVITDTISITGDFDNDGDIDVADWLLFAAQLGANTPGPTDLTGDGVNNYADFQRFKQLFENLNGAGSFKSLRNATPEPSSVVLLALAGLMLSHRREPQRSNHNERLSSCAG